jgi:hypothetical protein
VARHYSISPVDVLAMPLFWKNAALTAQGCEAEAAETERKEQKQKADAEARRLRQLGH